MAERELVKVHEETHEAEARIVVGFLQSQGIEAMIIEDDAGQQLPSLETVRGVEILVPAEDGERARALLAEREQDPGTR